MKTIMIAEETHERVKICCAHLGIKVSEFTNAALCKMLEEYLAPIEAKKNKFMIKEWQRNSHLFKDSDNIGDIIGIGREPHYEDDAIEIREK